MTNQEIIVSAKKSKDEFFKSVVIIPSHEVGFDPALDSVELNKMLDEARKDEAYEFGKWMLKKECEFVSDRLWMSEFMTCTTEQLYELFKTDTNAVGKSK